MPELPQVETVRKFLQKVLLTKRKKTIKTIHTYYPNIIRQIDPKTFINTLIGQYWIEIDRYGKYLILKLNNHSIISHLRMQGKYTYYKNRPQILKHDHIEFIMNDGSCLIYSDVRKFGTMYLIEKGFEMKHKSLCKLGPQINNEYTLTVQYLQQICKRSHLKIKQLLLKQELVCGIGNIYVDQILYASGIHPESKSNNLLKQHLQIIIKESQRIISDAIQHKGTTIKSFSANHQQGTYQNQLQVYGRQGLLCLKCRKCVISKIKVGGRGTSFCLLCQLKIY